MRGADNEPRPEGRGDRRDRRRHRESEAVFAVDYRGISVPQAAELRAKLREADATFRVVKNSLTERAADQAGAEALKAFLRARPR